MPSLSRRTLLRSSALALACRPFSALAADKPWPTRAITLIVAFSPGGFTDVAARLMASELSKELGVKCQDVISVQIEPGDGNSAADALVRAMPVVVV